MAEPSIPPAAPPDGEAVRDEIQMCGAQFLEEVFPRELESLAGAPAGSMRRVDPSTRYGLTGLALSGGGIRSATFCLGALQALAKLGVLRHVDYLSTVSGGGFIGSCLSSLLATGAGTGWARASFPFHHELGTDEPAAVKHLRDSGRYLAPEGWLDRVKIPALLLAGALVNVLLLAPYLLLAVMATHLAVQMRFHPLVRGVYDALPAASIGGLLLAVLVVFVIRRCCRRPGWGVRDGLERVVAVAVLVALGGLALHAWPSVLRGAVALLQSRSMEADLAAALAAAGFLAPALFSGAAGRLAGAIGGRVLLSLAGLLGPLFVLAVYLRLCAWLVYGVAPGWAPHAAWVLLPHGHWLYAASAPALFALGALLVDLNDTSMHGFYRDRLSRAYLMRWGGGGDVVAPNDGQRLSGLAPGRPIHLINAAINLQGCRAPDLRGRDADFFVFSRLFCGSRRTGYSPTAHVEAADPRLDLGTATAISGAAAAPNMGVLTVRPLTFAMALLNIRLNYWLPNPAWLGRPLARRLVPRVYYFLKELAGLPDERAPHVNLSDGGHIENLGVYELLRRRCRTIIAIDAGCDPKASFADLARLACYARIDLGVLIELDLEPLRPDAAANGRRHAVAGTIRYSGGETGMLLYVKSSMTGDENELARGYRAQRPAFPHESTGDQFFDEAQFEAYRYLGYHAVHRAPGGRAALPAVPEPEGPGDDAIGRWMERVREALAGEGASAAEGGVSPGL